VLRGPAQVIFIDTPGIFEPRRRLDRAMVAAAWSGAADADIVVHLVDSERAISGDTRRIVDGLAKSRRKAILALNKIDLVKPPKLLGLADKLNETGVFSDIFMISAETGDGVDDLMAALEARLPAGPWLFPEDQVSDMPARLLAAEITREKLFIQLHEELPYSLTVETESWDNFKDGSVRIGQIVYVRRGTQKAIVLGKGGRRIKSVGADARAELQEILDRKVHLFLHVKVRENWIENPERYRDWGLDFNA
jgi:GTP-binding protein Era